MQRSCEPEFANCCNKLVYFLLLGTPSRVRWLPCGYFFWSSCLWNISDPILDLRPALLPVYQDLCCLECVPFWSHIVFYIHYISVVAFSALYNILSFNSLYLQISRGGLAPMVPIEFHLLSDGIPWCGTTGNEHRDFWGGDLIPISVFIELCTLFS